MRPLSPYKPNCWRWTAMVVGALRAALAPQCGLSALLEATRAGQLGLHEPPRRRKLQRDTLRDLLREWILG